MNLHPYLRNRKRQEVSARNLKATNLKPPREDTNVLYISKGGAGSDAIVTVKVDKI